MLSLVVTTTAVGTATWLIQRSDEKSQTADMAETAVAREVRLSWAAEQRFVAGSSMRPSSAVPKASAFIRCTNGFHCRAEAIVGAARAASRSAGDPRTLVAVEHNTRPDNREACRLCIDWATMPPME